MIESIRLKNILSYEDLTLDFHKGVNMIIGKSDKGKSGIIDGMMWPISHRPLGDVLMSWWEGLMESEIKLDNGTILLRRENQNQYVINGDEENPLKAFGRAVPDEVADLLNLDIKINIQRQLEREAPIFLISESPGEVARFFNRVVGIDIIDRALKAGNKDISADTSTIKHQKTEISKKQAEIDGYKGLDTLRERVYSADVKSVEIGKIRDRKNAITEQIQQIEQIERGAIKKLEEQVRISGRVKKAITIEEKVNQNRKKIRRLSKTLSRIEETKKDIDASLEIIGHKSLIGQITNRQTGMKSVQQTIDRIQMLLNGIEETKKEGLALKEEKEKLEATFEKMIPDVCPFCGRI